MYMPSLTSVNLRGHSGRASELYKETLDFLLTCKRKKKCTIKIKSHTFYYVYVKTVLKGYTGKILKKIFNI